MEMVVGLGLILLLFGGMVWAGAAIDRAAWKRFRSCGHKPRLFDIDSQGGRGWTCDICGTSVWISWGADKEERASLWQ